MERGFIVRIITERPELVMDRLSLCEQQRDRLLP